MANVTTVEGNSITITGLDADWYLDNDMPGYYELRVESISFDPSANDDVMVIRNSKDGTSTVGEMFNVTADAAAGVSDQRIEYYHGEGLAPFIDISACTLGTAANASVTIIFR